MLNYFDFFNFIETINLKIKRTAESKRSCNHPLCVITTRLTQIPKEMRYRIAVEHKVFIPMNAVVCCNHILSETWLDVNECITSEKCKFTEKHLEEMFQLLSNPPPKTGVSKESSTYTHVWK